MKILPNNIPVVGRKYKISLFGYDEREYILIEIIDNLNKTHRFISLDKNYESIIVIPMTNAIEYLNKKEIKLSK